MYDHSKHIKFYEISTILIQTISIKGHNIHCINYIRPLNYILDDCVTQTSGLGYPIKRSQSL